MRHLMKQSLFMGLCAVLVLLTGCRKTSTPPPPSGDQLAREQAFQSTTGVIVCELKKVKLDSVELPQNQPYFIYDMQRNDKDTLLRGELTIEKTDFAVLMPIEKNPGSEMALCEKSSRCAPYWWGADDINSVHKINGKDYEFCTLDSRTRFAARPYTGTTGLFKVGKGGRSVDKMEFKGSVKSEPYAAAIGDVDQLGWPKPCTEYEIPAGDYYPAIMDIKYDNLAIMISNNYHRDVNGKQTSERKPTYGFKIRPDAPCVLDFSNPPVVVFDEPAPDANRFKPGDEIKFAAVLVDPKLDIMIRGLRDESIEVDKEYTDAAGNKISYKEKKSLDPNVVIARADGEIVAQGVMPFG